MHVDTGPQLPGGPRVSATSGSSSSACKLIVASVPDAIDARPRPEEPGRVAQPDPDAGAARGDRGARLRRRLRRSAPRRGEGAGEGAGVLVPRRVRAVGPEEPAPGALEPVQRPRPARASTSASSRSRTGPSSTSGTYIAREGHRDRRLLLRARARGVQPRRHAVRRQRVHAAAATARSSSARSCATARRRHDLHRRGRVRRRHPRRRSSRRSPPSGSPSAAPPAATTSSRKPPWKTASARATSSARRSPAVRHGRVRRRRQEHAHRAAAVRLEDHLRGPARGRRADQPRAWATTTPTSRCSPTACAPSGSRASRSTWPTATSPRRAGKFIIADTPGHIQYTRNMVTGASTADLALILLDARKGVARAEPPPRVPRDAAAASRTSCCASTRWTWSTGPRTCSRRSGGVHASSPPARRPRPDVHPAVGAARRQRRDQVEADALVRRARRCCTTWSALYVASDRNLVDVRFPVQYVIRPQSHDRHRLPRLRRHGRLRACSSPATRSSSCPVGLRDVDRIDRDRRRPGRRSVPADVGHDHARPTTSTSAAATCSAGRTTCPTIAQDIDAQVCWMDESAPLTHRGEVRDQAHDPLGAGARREDLPIASTSTRSTGRRASTR